MPIPDKNVAVRKLYRRVYITFDQGGEIRSGIAVEFSIHRDKLAEILSALPDELGAEAFHGPVHMRVVARQGVQDGRWGEWEHIPDDTP